MRIGNYKILKEISKGGFGRIFQAEHLLLGEKACLKQNIQKSVEDVELLKNEARILWRLNEYHSIPSTKDFLLLDKLSAILVMGFIEGETLEDVVEKSGPLAMEDACWVTERLLGALYYAHYYGVVHADVKPGNVFVEPQKHDIKLIDFGLATYKPDRDTRVFGYTLRYSAPELLAGNPPIPQTDIYGAGVVMLRALGGDVKRKQYGEDTPIEIVNFCNRLLKPNPLERPGWENENPLEMLSDIRLKVFGRRHLSNIKVKGGAR